MAADLWTCALSRFRRMLSALFLCSIGIAQTITIQSEGGAYKVSGWKPVEPSDGWASVFSVYTGTGDVPAMLGSYTIEEGALVFRPRFPVTGVRVRAVFHLPNSKP